MRQICSHGYETILTELNKEHDHQGQGQRKIHLLTIAVGKSDHDMVTLLLSYGALPLISSTPLMNPLVAAISQGKNAIAKSMITKCDANGYNGVAVQTAVNKNNLEMVIYLIGLGAVVRDDNYWSAISYGNSEILRVLINAAKSSTNVDDLPKYPEFVVIAVERGHAEVLKILIEEHLDVSEAHEGTTPVIESLRSKEDKFGNCFQILLKAKVDLSPIYNNPKMHYDYCRAMIRFGLVDSLAELIKNTDFATKFCDVNEVGETMYRYATFSSSIAVRSNEMRAYVLSVSCREMLRRACDASAMRLQSKDRTTTAFRFNLAIEKGEKYYFECEVDRTNYSCSAQFGIAADCWVPNGPTDQCIFVTEDVGVNRGVQFDGTVHKFASDIPLAQTFTKPQWQAPKYSSTLGICVNTQDEPGSVSFYLDGKEEFSPSLSKVAGWIHKLQTCAGSTVGSTRQLFFVMQLYCGAASVNFGGKPFAQTIPVGFKSFSSIAGEAMLHYMQYYWVSPKYRQYDIKNVPIAEQPSWKIVEPDSQGFLDHYFYDWADAVKVEENAPLIAEVLQTNPHHAQALAAATDEYGRKAAEVGAPACRKLLKAVRLFMGKYEFTNSLPEHKSASSVVYLAKDEESQRKVAVKFIKNKDNYLHEVLCRKNASLDSMHVMNILADYDRNNVDFKTEVAMGKTANFEHCIVMPAAQRNLLNILQQENIAGNENERVLIQKMFGEIARSVAHLHAKEIVHGDIKPLNIMRCDGGNLVLIDLDGSVALFKDPPERILKVSHEPAHRSTSLTANILTSLPQMSTAYCPPEAFHLQSTGIVVKTGEHALVADTTFDMWALGAVLFFMCTGEPLFNGAYDMVSGVELQYLYEWTDGYKRVKLEKVGDLVVRNLVSTMLSKTSATRCTMSELLAHPYLTGNDHNWQKIHDKINLISINLEKQTELLLRIDKRTQRIEDLSLEVFAQIRASEQVLLRGMFDATEVNVPTCFVIVNQELSPMTQLDMKCTVVVGAATLPAECERSNSAKSWFKKLGTVGSLMLDTALNAGDIDLPGAVKQFALDLAKDRDTKYYFYLVDEFTMCPIVPNKNCGSKYPILIEVPSAFIPKMLPFLKIGMKAVCLANRVTGVARMLGYPLPSVSQDVIQQVQDFVGGLDKESSVSDWNCLQSSVRDVESTAAAGENGSISSTKNVRGVDLRELKDFFGKYDEQLDFCGLCRVSTPEGYSCWTLPENVEIMRNAGKEKEAAFLKSKFDCISPDQAQGILSEIGVSVQSPHNGMAITGSASIATDGNNDEMPAAGSVHNSVVIETANSSAPTASVANAIVPQSTALRVPVVTEVANPIMSATSSANASVQQPAVSDSTTNDSCKLDAVLKELRDLRRVIDAAPLTEKRKSGSCIIT